jgi:mannose-6-phosphate isomerase-like protein (cupin superfamily)
MRRVVTGVVDGESAILSDSETPRQEKFDNIPGLEVGAIWSTQQPPTFPPDPNDPTTETASWVAPEGGTLFMSTVIPPGAAVNRAFETGAADPAAIPGEMMKRLPGLAECYDPNVPGIHQTPTIDYVAIVSGELCLELDDGEKVMVRAGDCVVQNGTRHAWHNVSDEPAVFVAVMVGAKRS